MAWAARSIGSPASGLAFGLVQTERLFSAATGPRLLIRTQPHYCLRQEFHHSRLVEAIDRLWITRLCRCVWLPCFWASCMAVFGVAGLNAPDGVQSVSGDGRGIARPIAVWRTICHRRRRRLSDDDLVDLAGASWQERLGKSGHPRRGRGQRKAGTRFRRKNHCLQMRRLPAAK